MNFTIITITHNSEKHLEETIKSVLMQKHEEIEYLLIDGRSRDNTLEIIKHYAEQDKRIRFISEPDQGIADAMNKGIGLANGDVIAHLHSDDYYPNSTVISEVNYEIEKKPECMWLTGGMYIVDSHGQILDDLKVRNYSYQKLINTNIILHPSTFIKRKAFEMVGMFNNSLRFAMDYDLWLRLGGLSDPLTLDKPLSCFRAHDNSLSTTNADAAFDEAWEVRKKHLGGNFFLLLKHYMLYRKNRIIKHNYMKKMLISEKQT